MRVRHAILSAFAGPALGYLASLVGALWLRGALGEADFVWNAISPLRISSWFFTSAHGVPLDVRSAAGVSAPDAPGSIGRLSELLGGTEEVVFSFSVVLMPITILAITGIVTALMVRRSNPKSVGDVVRWSALCAVVQGSALSAAAWLSSVTFALEANLAPDFGLGSATGRVGIGLGPRPLLALALGAGWGAAFATAGGMSALSMGRFIDANARSVLLGWMKGLGVAAGSLATAMAVGGVAALLTGHTPKPSLVGLGAFLLAANAIAAGIVLVHGASMAVALDAGPFTGWERMDFLNIGVNGEAAPPALWLLALIPVAAGIVGGRFARRHSTLSPAAIAVRYGALWGLTLAMLSLLLRVRVLSSFSVGSLDLGGGSVAFDPLVALALGVFWGTAASYLGARTPSASLWTCTSCGLSNTDDDRFCVSCGAAAAITISTTV